MQKWTSVKNSLDANWGNYHENINFSLDEDIAIWDNFTHVWKNITDTPTADIFSMLSIARRLGP